MNKKILFLTLIVLTFFAGCKKDEIIDNLQIETETVVLDEEETTVVVITAGSGQYSVASADVNIASSLLDGNKISITGVKEGETSIKITDIKSKQEKQIKVTVNKLIIAVESITLNPDKITVTDTKPFTLEVIILPENATDKSVRFESNNFDVAVVDEHGVVTPTGTGEVVISAFTGDGNKEAICKLTVQLPLPEGVVIENGLLRSWPCDAIPESGRVVIPDEVTEIRKYTFKNCDKLKKIIIPQSVIKIGTGAFESCINLREVTIPGSVENAGSGTFKGCTNLEKAILEEGVAKIFGGFFQDCENLIEVSLPSSLQKLTSWAFSGCKSLSDITIPKGISDISDTAFSDCLKLTKIDVVEENQIFASEDGVLFYKDKQSLLRYPSGKEAETYTIPSLVTYIGANAFATMAKLKEITIPSSVTSIGASAFYNLNNSGTLNLIHCKGTTPPDIEGWAGDLGYEGIVKVPAESVDAYKAAKGWKDCTIESE